MGNLHNRRVKSRTFIAGELVLRRVFENTANPMNKKFQPNWEGPYMVVRPEIAGSYALSRLDRTVVPNMWNAILLVVFSLKIISSTKIIF